MNKGIAFSLPIDKIKGTHVEPSEHNMDKGRDTMLDYEAMFVIVERGRAEEVVEYASSVGAKGATIIPARGSGIHEKETLFNITIEPEKEIVMLLVKEDKADEIAQKIDDEINLDAPGSGILFILPVSQASGLVQ